MQNISKLSDSMNQYLAQTEVETFEITEDQELVELSPQDLQGQITHKCITATSLGCHHNQMIADACWVMCSGFCWRQTQTRMARSVQRSSRHSHSSTPRLWWA